MVVWPQSLVIEIAERRAIVVLGAGASASCVAADGSRPPTWEVFLTNLAGRLPEGNADRTAAIAAIQDRQYLDAAEILRANIPAPEFSLFIDETFREPHFPASEIHQIVQELDPKIVLTTNYDDIYDRLCTHGEAEHAYAVCRYYEDRAVNAIRSRARVIFKAHGCLSDPTRIVLSRADYFGARRNYQPFYEVLDALFLTHTLLFVGCGLNDPDIQLVLENVNISAPSEHPHYALVPSGRNAAIKAAIRRTYNLELLEYPADNHASVVTALRDLQQQVDAHRAQARPLVGIPAEA